MMKRIFLYLMIVAITGSCAENKSIDKKTYLKEFENWRMQRIKRLKADNGWLNLVGLYWLHPGENTFGSDSSDDIVFPGKAPAIAGKFVLTDSIVTMDVNKGVQIFHDKLPVKNMELTNDNSNKPTILKMGSLVWFVIKRENRYGIRLRDLESPVVKQLDSIPAFPADPGWAIEATFKPFKTPEVFKVATVIGTKEDYVVPGELVFKVNGKHCKLLPSKEGDGFFIVFADETTGTETYPSGRFLYTPLPEGNNKVLIDFNKAYNPPCAFTPYATCPMPPRQNFLPVAITAGEKTIHPGHF